MGEEKNKYVRSQDMVGVYSELAELIDTESVKKIYERFRGQQVVFPMRLYTKEFVLRQAEANEDISIKKLAAEYGYSERRLRQIINEHNKNT